MIGDTELLDLRQLYYSLLVKLFWTEPAPELIETLKKDLADRAAGAGELHPLLGEGWLAIGKALEKMGVEQVADEYTRMFLGPFQPQVSPYESLYLTGMLFKEPLIE
ncbi:MAG: molecular chaperone TorD family protein, partial [bacterium]